MLPGIPLLPNNLKATPNWLEKPAGQDKLVSQDPSIY